MIKSKNKLLLVLMWIIEGVVVGFGAILPGISGGTLCVAFGMYRPIIETLSHLKTGLKKHWLMFFSFILGVAIGFVGLSGLAAWLMEKNALLVTCAFIGFILGTLPDLWGDAGKEGRTKGSYISLAVCFAAMIAVLAILKTSTTVTIQPGIWGFLFCGIAWGLSFIVPGLSSSTLLLFFGLYQPMLEGISKLDFSVLIPMGIGMLVCVLLLTKLVNKAYEKHYSIVSHGVLGILAATAVMIIPFKEFVGMNILWSIVCIVGGFAVSYMFTRICNKIKEKNELEEAAKEEPAEAEAGE